jgi:hypothetical protein
MISLIDRNDTKAPRFKAKLVAILLRATIKGLATSDIDKLIRNSTSSGQISALTIHTIKKYLYYLIEYGLILYDGTNQVFIIKNSGINLLAIIIMSIKKYSLDIEKMSIGFE